MGEKKVDKVAKKVDKAKRSGTMKRKRWRIRSARKRRKSTVNSVSVNSVSVEKSVAVQRRRKSKNWWRVLEVKLSLITRGSSRLPRKSPTLNIGLPKMHCGKMLMQPRR